MIKLIFKVLIFVFFPGVVLSQTGSITNITVSQRTDGSGNVDIYYDLAGPGSGYFISMEVSFDNGSTFTDVSSIYLSGNIGWVSLGNNLNIIWNGKGSNNNTYSNQAKVKLIASDSQIPTDGLVAWYPFNGNANDESGNGNNGTVNGATLTTDRFGNVNSAYYFDGENDYIEISDHASLRPDNISISAWIYAEHSTPFILGKSVFSNASNEQYTFDGRYLNVKRNSGCYPGVGWYSGATNSYTLNNWYHITGSYDGYCIKIYINGNLSATNSNIPPGPIDNCQGGNIRIGLWWAYDPLNFKGKLDDIRIFNRALNDAEIQALYIENIEDCPASVNYAGKTYNTVQIGTQCWFKENLNIGTRISGLQEQTNNQIIEKYCYNNDEANCAIYGGLYQWDEMMGYVTTAGAQGICPPGWHIPTDNEWCMLTLFFDQTVNCGIFGGTGPNAGGKMKSIGTIQAGTGLWYSPNTGASNESGFTAFPAGGLNSDGTFYNIGYYCYWWSSSEGSSNRAWYRYLSFSYSYVFRDDNFKNKGVPLRCIHD